MNNLMLIKSVALHDNFKYAEPCAEILCEEWGRSQTSRLVILEKSRNSMPYNIVLLQAFSNGNSSNISNFKSQSELENNIDWIVIGHSRLCAVAADPNAAFVESVVVRKKCRGQGYGRVLMKETEDHAKRLNIGILYLTTHDKCEFYSHIGYEFCLPIVSLGNSTTLLSPQQIEKLFSKGNNEKFSSQNRNYEYQANNAQQVVKSYKMNSTDAFEKSNLVTNEDINFNSSNIDKSIDCIDLKDFKINNMKDGSLNESHITIPAPPPSFIPHPPPTFKSSTLNKTYTMKKILN